MRFKSLAGHGFQKMAFAVEFSPPAITWRSASRLLALPVLPLCLHAQGLGANLRGLDWETRYREYQRKVAGAATLNAGVAEIAAYLEALKDSHTYFVPPARPYQIDYGYRIAMVGDDALIMRVRPDTDAEAKVKPGDRVIGVNGNAIGRQSLHSMEYFFHVLSPQQSVRLTVRDRVGQQRDVVVTPKVRPSRQVRDLTGMDNGMDFADMIRDEEAADHLMRHRSQEIGDVLVWKMPIFNQSNAQVDGMFGLARGWATRRWCSTLSA